MRQKYILHLGYSQKNEFIGAVSLAKAHGVRLEECIIYDFRTDEYKLRGLDLNNYVDLYVEDSPEEYSRLRQERKYKVRK